MALQRAWYEPRLRWWLWLLWPLQWLFLLLSSTRRWAYQRGWLRVTTLPVPVIVVGNINVGGSGKTPVTLALVRALQAAGWRPGIIARGYGGKGPFPLQVQADTMAQACGDEPKLLQQRLQVPVVVAPDRVAAGRMLLAAHPEVNVLLSDDGLQHYALARSLEMVVIDGQRGFGNGWRLPMGPLREPLSRLAQVDMLLQNGGSSLQHPQAWRFALKPQGWRRVRDQQPIDALPAGDLVALAGIAAPQRFFVTLQQLGVSVRATHAFADHQPYSAALLQPLAAGKILLMTEKDAVKCAAFAGDHWYYLAVDAELPEPALALIMQSLSGFKQEH